MRNIFTNCFLETFPLQGVDVYYDEYHPPYVPKANRDYVKDWRILLLGFMGLPTQQRHLERLEKLSNKQLAKDVALNFIGLKETNSTWFYWLNTLLIIPTLTYRITKFPFCLAINIFKLCTQFLPRVVVSLLNQWANNLENYSVNNTQPSSIWQRLTFIMLAVPIRLLSHIFSAIRFISRALTNPIEGVQVGWRIGNKLGGISIGESKQGLELERTKLSIFLGGVLAGLSGLLSGVAFFMFLPFILYYFGHSNLLNKIPNIEFPVALQSILESIWNTILNGLIKCFGFGRVVNTFHLDIDQEPLFEMYLLRLAVSIAANPHTREVIAKFFLKASLIFKRGKDEMAAVVEKSVIQFESTCARLMSDKLKPQLFVAPAAQAPAEISTIAPAAYVLMQKPVAIKTPMHASCSPCPVRQPRGVLAKS